MHKVDLSVPCKEWTGAKTSKGYGCKRDESGRVVRVHRWEFEKAYGPLPAHIVVRHACDNPACYELLHLESGTQTQNIADRVKRKRSAVGERNGGSKITESDVLEIRRSNMQGKLLAAKFGISASQVSEIRSGKKWSHLTL